MLDVFAILSSTLCVLYILVRAAFLDRTLPWFEAEDPSSRNKGTSAGGPTGRSRKF
jgi:hypothetical protein